MKSVLFLVGISALLTGGGFGLVNHDALALSCQEDGTGICDEFVYRGPPLKQLESGAGLGDVFCSNTHLMIKASTGTPACVFDPTFDKLLERGWGTTLDDHIKNGPAFEIILDQGPCFGFCPTYSVTITNDGKLVFEGIENLETVGIKTDMIDSRDIANLISYVERIDYFSLEDPDDGGITDIPRTVTTVTIGDKTNAITNIPMDFGNLEVAKLESMINDLADSQNRIEGTVSDNHIPSETATSTLYVDSQLVDCVGVGPQQCMLVRENPDSEWEMFYDHIDGFTYQEGTEYVISVKITEVKSPPADGSSLKYVLVDVLDPVNYGCELDHDPGLCKAYIPRYYFDETSNSCQEFVWGGCNGVVPFETLSACRQQCG
ncbi:DUF4377 domain-containing protein [archaeon]|nr:DUF4377 domain-containing protein [archaeon]